MPVTCYLVIILTFSLVKYLLLLSSSSFSGSDVTYATSHIFQHEDNTTCNTMQPHKHKQQWREERDARFLSWKYSHFEFVSAKDENIKVHCALCAGDKVLSSFKNTTSNLRKCCTWLTHPHLVP